MDESIANTIVKLFCFHACFDSLIAPVWNSENDDAGVLNIVMAGSSMMHVDKPMRGHGLMRAIAGVNRVFKDKPGGLVVDYLGIAHELKLAFATYTESGGKGQTALPLRRGRGGNDREV